MMPISVSKSVVRTWCGRTGTNFTLHFDKSRLGKRVDVIRWHSSGRVELRAIKGDGRTASFHAFGNDDFFDDHLEPWQDRAARIARELANRHFQVRS